MSPPRVHGIERLYLTAFIAIWLLIGVTGAAGQAATPTPKATPTPPPITPITPPTPPPGPSPWKGSGFINDKKIVLESINKSTNPNLKLEDYRLSTEEALRMLEHNRASGRVNRQEYKRGIVEYRKSIDVYRELSKSK